MPYSPLARQPSLAIAHLAARCLRGVPWPRFVAMAVDEQSGNFLRRLALPASVAHWSLTTLRERLIKIGAKVMRTARYVVFQMAEVAVPRHLFRTILDRIHRLRPAKAESV